MERMERKDFRSGRARSHSHFASSSAPSCALPASKPHPKTPPTLMRVLYTILAAACLGQVGQVVAPPPQPPSQSNSMPSFAPAQATEIIVTAWKAMGAPATALPALPLPVGGIVPGREEVSEKECGFGGA